MPPRLSIIVPAYNEERTIGQIMDRLVAACGSYSEIIYVDDGSKDKTLSIMQQKVRPQDRVISKPNGGKGSAVRRGYEEATGAYCIVQDADLEYSPEEIGSILEAAEGENSAAVFGSRRLKKQKQYVHLLFFIGGSLLTYLCNLLYRTHLTDQPTCYKLVRRDLLSTFVLKENDFRFDPELTVLIARSGNTIDEVPISYHPRSIAEGKKINWRDWFRWVWVFVTLRFIKRKSLYRTPTA